MESDSGVKTKLGHNGMDFDGEIGDRINSVKLGKVEEKGYDKGYGNYLVIRHKDGTKALYAHLSKFFVDEGSPVFAGMKIAEMGNTGKVVSESGGDGSHLHFGYDGNRDGRFSSNNSSDNPAALLFGGEF